MSFEKAQVSFAYSVGNLGKLSGYFESLKMEGCKMKEGPEMVVEISAFNIHRGEGSIEHRNNAVSTIFRREW